MPNGDGEERCTEGPTVPNPRQPLGMMRTSLGDPRIAAMLAGHTRRLCAGLISMQSPRRCAKPASADASVFDETGLNSPRLPRPPRQVLCPRAAYVRPARTLSVVVRALWCVCRQRGVTAVSAVALPTRSGICRLNLANAFGSPTAAATASPRKRALSPRDRLIGEQWMHAKQFLPGYPST